MQKPIDNMEQWVYNGIVIRTEILKFIVCEVYNGCCAEKET